MNLPDAPLRLLPRWAALGLLLVTLAACIWSTVALSARAQAHGADIEQRIDRGEQVDMDLYREVHRRVAGGEEYYPVALAGNRAFHFPTRPFVTVRTPVLAWGAAVWGDWGWRAIAAVLWAGNILAWFLVLAPHASRRERDAAGTLSALFGAAAFIPVIPYSHELIAGLLLSLALPLSASRWWLAGLACAVAAIAVRELAFPILFAWAAVALIVGSRRELAAVLGAVALVACGLWLHAEAVAAARLPADATSPGWMGMFGPALPFFGIVKTTLLQLLPNWLAGPLVVLPLLGWAALGGRAGALAGLWFAGFIAAAAIFARQENFYWMGLFVPAYGVGLAFVPRALTHLLAALTPPAAASPTP